MPPAISIEALREEWNNLYKNILPFCAYARIPVQAEWPVSLDHCFARIILDNAVGKTKPWMEVIKAPAVKNMTEEQLCAAVDMANEITEGKVDLVKLNENSLSMRGKEGPSRGKGRVTMKKFLDESEAEGNGAPANKRRKLSPETDTKEQDFQSEKRKTGEDDVGISKYFLKHFPRSATRRPPQDESARAPSTLPAAPPQEARDEPNTKAQNSSPPITQDNATSQPVEEAPGTDPLTLIATSALTPFRKEVLVLLCGIPPGQWTTYAAMSRHVNRVRSKSSQSKTCARAIGNAMRNNPFAPTVPCHRVLAADGSIGGFGGDWGEGGKHAGEKKRLLREEGVRFDGKGKAVGSAWEGWK